MALGHAPSIIMDGIVAYIDVANVRSYPGSGDVVTDLINGFLSTGTGISASQMSAIGATFGTNKNTSFSNELITVSNTSYTKCCWFNLEDVSTYQPLICGTLYQRHCMWMNKTDKLTASHSNTTPFSSPTFTSIAGTTTLSTGNLVFWCCYLFKHFWLQYILKQ